MLEEPAGFQKRLTKGTTSSAHMCDLFVAE